MNACCSIDAEKGSRGIEWRRPSQAGHSNREEAWAEDAIVPFAYDCWTC